MLKFTDRARKIMTLANQYAGEWNHEYIGTEHILMGLIKEESGIGYAALNNLNISIAKMQDDIKNIVSKGPDIVSIGRRSQVPRAKRVVEFALKVAREMNHSHVGTEHILLGLIENEEDMAAQILMSTGITKEEIKTEILLLLDINEIDDKRTCTNCIHSDFCDIFPKIFSQHMEVIQLMVGTNESLSLIEDIKQLFGNRCKNFERNKEQNNVERIEEEL